MNTNKTWTEEEIRNLILTNDKMVVASLKKLYSYQTLTEKNWAETRDANGVGFNAYDAPFLTSVAKFYEINHYVSPKQVAIVRKKLLKYVKQLTRIANNEI